MPSSSEDRVPLPLQSSTFTDSIRAPAWPPRDRGTAAIPATTVPCPSQSPSVSSMVLASGARPTVELGVGGVHPGVQHVDRHPGAGGRGGVAAVQRERALVDPVQAPVGRVGWAPSVRSDQRARGSTGVNRRSSSTASTPGRARSWVDLGQVQRRGEPGERPLEGDGGPGADRLRGGRRGGLAVGVHHVRDGVGFGGECVPGADQSGQGGGDHEGGAQGEWRHGQRR